MKKIAVFFLIVFMALGVFAFSSSAETLRLYDGADLLTDAEETALLSRLDEVSAKRNLDVVIVTVYDTGEKSAVAFADDYYDEHGFKADGILLLIRMKDRYLYMSTAGEGITVFTDAGIEYIGDRIAEDHLADDDFYGGFLQFVDLCDQFVDQAEEGEPYDYGNMPRQPLSMMWIGIAAVSGLVIGSVVTGMMKSKLKSVRFQPAATAYVRNGSLNLTNASEIFLYHHVSRTRRETESSSRGGSSTHTSSSGSSHGGGGRHF